MLVAHEAGGLDEHELGRARRLAELGYVVLAIDYYGSRRVYTDPDEMMAQLIDLGTHPNRMRAIGRAALEVLTAEPRVDSTKVAAIGYCFGVVMMLELARDHADLKAVVGFHPGSADHDPADSRKITGKVLVCIGSEDPLMPAAERMASAVISGVPDAPGPQPLGLQDHLNYVSFRNIWARIPQY